MTSNERSEQLRKAHETFEEVKREMEQPTEAPEQKPARILTLDEMQAFAERQKKEQRKNRLLKLYPEGNPEREKIEERFRNQESKKSK